ncbi:MAG: glutamate--tRNA ligase [bacterium]
MDTKEVGQVRVRFAPSPTGYLHLGGARTAIFNWLFARKHQGKFLLRIEDTDVSRSGKEMVETIFEALKWLGLDWDGDPVFQSQRFHIYKHYAERLLEEGKAYKCYCTADRLQRLRESAKKQGHGALKYDRHCLQLSESARQALQGEGKPFVVRFKVEEGTTTFQDYVYGQVRFDNEQIDDFIILRSDGIPTYHLAVVVDDKEMDITHIIRGDDHLSNTPKHVLLYRAFGWQCPTFAHVPLILGTDRQRLSKRHGATSVNEYKSAGYLSEALFNFLTLLGWSSGDNREFFTRAQLLEEFDLSGISKKSAVFDQHKLEWMNAHYLSETEDAQLLGMVLPDLIESGFISSGYAEAHRDYLLKIVGLLKSRMRRLTEFQERSKYFFHDPDAYDEKGLKKHWQEPATIERFKLLIERLGQIREFTHTNVEQVIRSLAEELGVSAAKIIHPLRLALTGVTASPGLFEIMALLGQDTVLRRLRRAVEYLQNRI